jgi:hypothetical protein
VPATLLDVCVLLLFASLYTYRLNYFNVTIVCGCSVPTSCDRD